MIAKSEAAKAPLIFAVVFLSAICYNTLLQELLRCEDTIQWYQKILLNPGVSQSAKDAAKDMLRQAERAKREILSKLQG